MMKQELLPSRSSLVIAWVALVACHGCGGGNQGTQDGGSHRAGNNTDSIRVRFQLASAGLPQQGIWKCVPALGDVNHDGFLDLAAINRHGKGPRVWLGDGGKSWRESSLGLDYDQELGGFSCGGGVRFGDVNKDGHLDLITADHCKGGLIFLGDGTGKWQRTSARFQLYDPTLHEGEMEELYAGTEDCEVADFDGDGLLDLAFAGSDKGGVAAFKGFGASGQWTASSDGLPTDNWANCLLAHDMNGDGKLDLVGSYWGPRVWLGDGKGRWTDTSIGLPTPTIGGLFRGVAVGDLNRDGRPDIVAANSIDGVEVTLQNADGTWPAKIDALPPMKGGAIGVATCDFDGDGNLDIIASGRMPRTAGRYYGLFLLLGDGKGGFTYESKAGLPAEGLSVTWCFTIGDVDKDGVNDFVVATGGSEPVSPEMPTSDVQERMQVWLTRRSK